MKADRVANDAGSQHLPIEYALHQGNKDPVDEGRLPADGKRKENAYSTRNISSNYRHKFKDKDNHTQEKDVRYTNEIGTNAYNDAHDEGKYDLTAHKAAQ